MARAPFNVHVLLYRKVDLHLEYAVLKRKDSGIWQGVAGGGEDDETPLECAKRETYEECGVPYDARYLKLSSITSVPVVHFRESYLWGEDIFVIPQYAFGVDATDHHIVLSEEHIEYRWLPYDEARVLLHYHNCKNDLWELNQRLKGKGPRG